ncbi:hypothetical protein ACGRHY_01225 [Streptomyces sp. HK10]|uniref:hypothetical protein n=1 Tax=Streptomyces sp. HK10 TaxID=3373255 RepID=UPI0037493C86
MVIQPAWTDVWIRPGPNGHLRAGTGRGGHRHRGLPRPARHRAGLRGTGRLAVRRPRPTARRRAVARAVREVRERAAFGIPAARGAIEEAVLRMPRTGRPSRG